VGDKWRLHPMDFAKLTSFTKLKYRNTHLKFCPSSNRHSFKWACWKFIFFISFFYSCCHAQAQEYYLIVKQDSLGFAPSTYKLVLKQNDTLSYVPIKYPQSEASIPTCMHFDTVSISPYEEYYYLLKDLPHNEVLKIEKMHRKDLVKKRKILSFLENASYKSRFKLNDFTFSLVQVKLELCSCIERRFQNDTKDTYHSINYALNVSNKRFLTKAELHKIKEAILGSNSLLLDIQSDIQFLRDVLKY
jgi:hypothetical protein